MKLIVGHPQLNVPTNTYCVDRWPDGLSQSVSRRIKQAVRHMHLIVRGLHKKSLCKDASSSETLSG